MSPTGDTFNHALHTANIWLADVGSAFGTRDRRYCHRAVRAYLHTLRDRLSVDAAVKFGQQLPELLRGTYYDGWEPSRVPMKYGLEQYTQRFAVQAGIPPVQVPATAATITEVIAGHMSPGQLAETLAELPTELRNTITGSTTMPSAGNGHRHHTAVSADGDRVARIEDQIGALTEAVRTLARGLENGRFTGSGVQQAEASRAARLADEILIAAGTESAP